MPDQEPVQQPPSLKDFGSAFGPIFCVLGSLTAVLYPPLKFMGQNVGWHYLFADSGMGAPNYQFIDITALMLELILINGIGFGLYFFCTRRGGPNI